MCLVNRPQTSYLGSQVIGYIVVLIKNLKYLRFKSGAADEISDILTKAGGYLEQNLCSSKQLLKLIKVLTNLTNIFFNGSLFCICSNFNLCIL